MIAGELIQLTFLIITGISTVYYFYTHFANIQAWKKIEPSDKLAYPTVAIPTDFFLSILVPARNESAHIIDCLTSIFDQDVQNLNFEVILIDDHSTDDTVKIAQEKFKNKLIILRREGDDPVGKKSAIKAGIKKAKGNWIVTTDADCQVPRNWLSVILNTINNNDPVFVAGPVLIRLEADTWLEKFQRLDIIGMMGVTAGGIHRKAAYLANGAHLSYSKTAFEQVGGFSGIDKKASGDDMLLLQKMVSQFPKGIAFAKAKGNSVVTAAENSWGSFFKQRLRWASKGNSFPNISTWIQMVLIFVFCSCFIFSIILLPLDFYFFGTIGLTLYVLKFIADYFYLSYFCKYFNSRELIKSIWWATIFHAIYIFVIGICAQFYNTYEWKGRRVK